MEYLLDHVTQKDVGKRLQVGQEVIDLILDQGKSPHLEQDQSMTDRVVDAVASSWVNSSNFKVKFKPDSAPSPLSRRAAIEAAVLLSAVVLQLFALASAGEHNIINTPAYVSRIQLVFYTIPLIPRFRSVHSCPPKYRSHSMEVHPNKLSDVCVFGGGGGVSLYTSWTAVRTSSHTAVLETPHPLVWFQVRIEDEGPKRTWRSWPTFFLLPDETV